MRDRIFRRMLQRALAVLARLQRVADLLLRQTQAEESGAAQAVVGALTIGVLAAADTHADEMERQLGTEAARKIGHVKKGAIVGARQRIEPHGFRRIFFGRGHLAPRVGAPQVRLRVGAVDCQRLVGGVDRFAPRAFIPVGARQHRIGLVVVGIEAHGFEQQPDRFVRVALLDQHRRALHARFDMRRVDRHRLLVVLHAVVVLEQHLVGLPEVIRGERELRVFLERALEQRGGLAKIGLALLALHRHQVHQAHRRTPRKQQFFALLVQRERGFFGLPRVADPERDGRFLARGNHHFLAVGLVAGLHALELMQAHRHARHDQRLTGVDLTDHGAVDVDVDVVHVGFNHRCAEHRRPLGAVRHTAFADAKQHFGLVIAAGGWGLRELTFAGIAAHVGADVFDQLIGGNAAVARVVIREALEGLDQVVGEEAVTGRKIRIFETLLALRCRGQREKAAGQLAELLFERFVRGFSVDLSGVAGVGQQHFPVRLDARRQHLAKRGHRIGGRFELVGIDVPRREVTLAVLHEAVARKIHHHAIGRLRHRRQPVLELAADVGERRLRPFQEVDVLGRERSAFAIDQHAVHRLGIALRKLQLLRGVEILILRDADNDGVTARHA